MATPVTSGVAALIRQYFLSGFYPSGVRTSTDSILPKASLIKAVLLNSGQKLKGARNMDSSVTDIDMYDSNEGFGRVNLIKTLRLEGENSIYTHASHETIGPGGKANLSIVFQIGEPAVEVVG